MAPASLLACNAILGNHERVVDEGATNDAKPSPKLDGGEGGTTDAAADQGPLPTDGDVPDDGAPLPFKIVVPNAWKSLNAGQFTLVDGGVTITGFTAPAGHPMIAPNPMPSIPDDDYTVEAVIKTPTNGEWGIMVRVAADGSGALIGSKFGGEQRLFTGNMGPPDFGPSQQNLGPVYTYTPNARYHMKLQVKGTQTLGKMWESTQAEPSSFQVLGTATGNKVRGVGYYVYNTYDTVLESMTITVP